MAKKRNAFVPLAGDLDPNSPDFIETLNDRLRRVAQQSATETRFKDIVGTMNAGQLPPEVPTTSDLPDGTVPRVVAKELVESGITDNGQRVSVLSRILAMLGFGKTTGIEFSSGPTSTTKSRIRRVVDGDRLDVSVNLDYDGLFERDDVAKGGALLKLSPTGLQVFLAAAGANPAVLDDCLAVNSDGTLRSRIKRDTLANIPTLAAADADYLFYATDQTVIYRWTGTVWSYYQGVMIAALASRPTPTANDAGFWFLASDTQDLYVWSGAAWIYYGGAQAAFNFVPVADGGVSLGLAAKRFLNASLSGKMNIGGASTPAYPLEILEAYPQIHLNDADADAGGWIWSSATLTTTYLSYGCYYNGSAWVAKATDAGIISINGTAGFRVRMDTGLTPGNTFTPTTRFLIDATGNITTVNAITAAGTVQAPTVNATSAFQANGTPGEAATTITYLTGTPGTGQSSKTVTFKEGIQTAHT